ncbi:TPA: hypothetical protein EYP66_05500 [Candidatus Poribacteria bacterium]|nr:hypothetical protein [Candidatus Poribacteria bacterium]
MNKFHLLTLIFILFVALINTANAATDNPKFYNLTSTLLLQQTLANTENTIPNSEQPLHSVLKSPSKAFLFSAFIPGTGGIYAESKRGYLYIATEIVFFAGYFLAHRSASSLKDDYLQQVRDHVKFDAEVSPQLAAKEFKDWNLEDFEHATMYDNWHNVYTEDDGKPLERVGPFYWEDRENVKDEDRQRNPDSRKRQVAFDLRQDSNERFKLAKTFLGLVIFNHLVSAIDARIAAKLYNKRLISEKSGLAFKTTVLPDSVESRFEFYRRF